MMAVLITAELATLAGERGKVGMEGAVRGQDPTIQSYLHPSRREQVPGSSISRPTPTVCYRVTFDRVTFEKALTATSLTTLQARVATRLSYS